MSLPLSIRYAECPYCHSKTEFDHIDAIIGHIYCGAYECNKPFNLSREERRDLLEDAFPQTWIAEE